MKKEKNTEEILNEIKLMMNYDLSKTLNENIMILKEQNYYPKQPASDRVASMNRAQRQSVGLDKPAQYKVTSKEDDNTIINFFKENEDILLQIGASIAVGIATGGQSLLVQALAQAAVQLPFSIQQLREGDSVGAVISLAIACLPIVGRYVGRTIPYATLKNIETKLPQLASAKTADEAVAVINQFQPEEKKLIAKVMTMPKEFENVIGKSIKKGIDSAVKKGELEIPKLTFKEQAWWKQMGVELPAAFGMAGGGEYFKLDPFGNKEDLTKSIQNTNPEFKDGVDF